MMNQKKVAGSAALKREMSKNVSKNGADFGQLGNAAKLREALDKIEKMAHCDLSNVYPKYRDKFNDMIGGIEREARAALAAPPRNCDLYNDVEDSWQDYKQFRRQTGEAIYFDMVHFWSFAKWLFAPATERKGETDEQK